MFMRNWSARRSTGTPCSRKQEMPDFTDSMIVALSLLIH